MVNIMIKTIPDVTIKYEVCEITPDGVHHLVDGCSYSDFDIAKTVIEMLRMKADNGFTYSSSAVRTIYKIRKRTVTVEDVEEKDLI